MSNIDKVSVKGEFFNIVSPSAFGDYIETIGGACTNTSGYAKDQIFLAKTNDVQNLYQATQAISFGANIVVGTNCKRTTLDEVIRSMSGASSASDVSYNNASSHLAADDVQEAIDEVQGNVVSVNSALTNVGNNLSHQNLLDNPWFTVNQREASSYSGDNILTFDRWHLWNGSSLNGTIAKSGNVVTLTRATGSAYILIAQRLEDYSLLEGKILTMSLLLADGTIKSGSGLFVNSSTPVVFYSVNNKIALDYASSGYFRFVCYESSIQIKAIKLELGSVSTLAMDTAPNYATELLKCQRYFVRVKSSNSTLKPFGFGFASDTTKARLSIPLSVPMRSAPTINFSDISVFRIYPHVARVSSPLVIGNDGSAIEIQATSSNTLTQYETLVLALGTENEYVDLSADL